MIRNPHISKLPYPPEVLGHVHIEADPQTVAGSMATVRITYTAGRFGIDDQGSLRFLLRFASDAGRPQFDRPGAPNYCTASASNGTKLLLEYHPRGAFRPWFKSIRVNVMREALREGDTLTLVLGDRSQGGAGWRTSTMREERFEVRVQVDPFGTVVYGDVAGSAAIDLVPGAPHVWKAVLPTLRRVGEPFELCVRADDVCGNPVGRLAGVLMFEADAAIDGLPARVEADGQATVRIDGLKATAPGSLRVRVRDGAGAVLAESNPLVVGAEVARSTWWGDFHAQSEETIGTNSARGYFEFARDKAFCDFVGHQGNDFQISGAFWAELNRLYARVPRAGPLRHLAGLRVLAGHTHLGGDRNIFFFDEGRPIRRSSHALVEDLSDVETDCNHVLDLFKALHRDGERALAFAHVGGRYADLHAGHDVEIERSVEVHSSWGTFEWLLFDAFELGYRVGVVCNSDDHKGRPGASHPGASIFGAYGGLSCLYLDALNRDAIWRCLQARHHYGTTGDRLHLAVDAAFDGDAFRYAVDPHLDAAAVPEPVQRAMMGDIVRVEQGRATVRVVVDAAAPIERIDLRCGPRTLETIRPYATVRSGPAHPRDLGRRRVPRPRPHDDLGRLARDRRQLIGAFEPINFWHLDKRLERSAPNRLAWESVTTGNFAGADILLESADRGELRIDTPHVKTTLALADVGFEDTVFEAGGLARQVRVFRLPDANPHRRIEFERSVDVAASGDTPIYVRRDARERASGVVEPDLSVPSTLTW